MMAQKNSDAEEEEAHKDMRPNAYEDLTPLLFPESMPENEKQKKQAEHFSEVPSNFRFDEWR